MDNEDQRLREAFAILDDMHREDPTRSTSDGRSVPASLLYHQRLGEWLDRMAPNASAALRLAVRSQHVRRWSIPRDSYPMNKKGYRDWRTSLARFHAQTAAEVLVRVGYDSETIARVQQLLRKERLRTDPEVRILEDAVCLVFLETRLEEFSQHHSEEKLLQILRKTWKKMSPLGHRLALELKLSETTAGLLQKALSKS